MKKVLTANQAVSYGAKLSRVQVIAAYPITPQTTIVEELSNMCASGELAADFIHNESEHSAMAACIGAAMTGARAFTATSAQGLALMHEMLHWAAGGRLPIVMANVNRSLAPPWTIFTDQSDSLSQRDTGWMQFYCESSQEVLDTIPIAFKISEQVLLPAMLVLDAFVLSHTAEIVEIPEPEQVDAFLPPRTAAFKLDPKEPHAFGGMMAADCFMESRYKIQEAMDEALEVAVRETELFHSFFGRTHPLVEPYRLDGAEAVLIVSGTASSTARIVVDELRNQGLPVGSLKIRLFRPFPTALIQEAVGNIPLIAVLDRSCSYGHGGIWAQEIRSAFYPAEINRASGSSSCHPCESRDPGSQSLKKIYGFITGLGGREVLPETLKKIFHYTLKRLEPKFEPVWVDVHSKDSL
jgi:pyruvate/2-oxoacid:ferredoxin oxidoreductase alpha subunit